VLFNRKKYPWLQITAYAQWTLGWGNNTALIIGTPLWLHKSGSRGVSVYDKSYSRLAVNSKLKMAQCSGAPSKNT